MSEALSKAAEVAEAAEMAASAPAPHDPPAAAVPALMLSADTPRATAKRTTRSKRKVASPTSSTSPPRPPAKLARYLPDAERVKVFKRDLGQRHYLRQYTPRDLNHAADIETFIQHHLVPVYGEGEYDVDVLAADGKVTRTVPVSVMDPRKPPPGMPAADAALGSVVDKLLSRLDQVEREARKPAKSLTEQLEEMARVQEMMGGGGSDPTTLMWMLQQQQQQAQTAKHGELAELRAEIQRLREQRAPATPPSLPPLPPTPTESIDVAGIIREATAAAKPTFDVPQLAELLAPKSNGIQDIVAAVTALTPVLERVLGPRGTELEQMRQQQLEILRDQIRDMKGTPTRGLRDILDEMNAVRDFVRQAGGGKPRADDSFWSFMRDLVGQFPNAMQSISGVVDRIRAEEQGSPPAPPARRQLASGAATPPPFPEGFDGHVKSIADATDDAGRIGATLTAFNALGSAPPWRAYLQKAMALARTGDTTAALSFVDQFLRGLADSGRLDEAVATATIEAFQRHADKVVEALRNAGG